VFDVFAGLGAARVDRLRARLIGGACCATLGANG
jgi:hypothetical protein